MNCVSTIFIPFTCIELSLLASRVHEWTGSGRVGRVESDVGVSVNNQIPGELKDTRGGNQARARRGLRALAPTCRPYWRLTRNTSVAGPKLTGFVGCRTRV